MSRTFSHPLQKKLARLIRERREAAGLSQWDVAKKIDRYQSWVTALETGGRRIDIVELIELGKVIGFDPAELVKQLSRK
jgi:ribosome-binding protein aMBF1 (putative translation factor)